MTKKSKPGEQPWIDPDDAPLWDEEQFRRAASYQGDTLLRPAQGTWTKRGRPPKDNPKQQITLRLDPEVVRRFRSTGRGWQSRINDELRKVLGI